MPPAYRPYFTRESDHAHEYPGCDLTPDAVEFGKAMEKWQRANHRWPDCADVLAIAKSLGYRRVL